MATPSYASAFKRHISYFDLDNDGVIWPYETLRGLLAVGFDFPVACLGAMSLPILYGNTGLLRLGIDVSKISPERTQLAHVKLEQSSYNRSELLSMVKGESIMDQIHITGLWGLAADRSGEVSKSDIALFQRGEMMAELRRRRQSRSEVIPLYRGGPISFVQRISNMRLHS